MKKTGIITGFLFLFITLHAQNRSISRSEYIETYRDIAIQEMRRTGVPASIKLAQALLESDNGNSRLAVKANNHFGIKCHASWSGKRIHHDDDHQGECFRKYHSAEESFYDHSDFLRGSSRYSKLFELDSRDYKGWARELRNAGYATNPRYAEMLIRIIEENNLQTYDLIALERKGKVIDTPDTGVTVGHQIFTNNRIDYIIAKEGENFESLRRELKVKPDDLRRINELRADDKIVPGQVLYLQPKRNKAEAGLRYHVVKQGETMYDIAQIYAVKLSALYSKNLMVPGEEPVRGQEISLRKQLKGRKTELTGSREDARTVKPKKKVEQERENIEFEFFR